MSLTENSSLVLSGLRGNVEHHLEGGWGSVYLDNARPAGMSETSFRSHLAVLSKAGLYRPVDGYAFGEVKVANKEADA
jgi:hypothetical protein